MTVPLASPAVDVDSTEAVADDRVSSRPWRARLTATVVAVVGLVLLVGVVLGPTMLRARLVADVDGALRARVVDLAGVDGRPFPEVLVGTGGDVAQVLQSPGTVVARSANLEGVAPFVDEVPLPGQTSLTSTELTVGGTTNRYRVAALTLESASAVAGRTVVVAGTSLEQIDDTVATVRSALGIGLVATLAIVGAATWIALNRTGATGRHHHPERDDDTGDGPVGPVLRNELRRTLTAREAELDRGLALPLTTNWVDLAHRQKAETQRLLNRLDGPDRV